MKEGCCETCRRLCEPMPREYYCVKHGEYVIDPDDDFCEDYVYDGKSKEK